MVHCKRFGSMLLSAAIFLGCVLGSRPAFSAGSVPQQKVRVGFFQADGYHELADDGTMSGYGFDFLQMLLRYNDWEYEYIGYDKNWGDMLDMLQNGQVDLVTLANKTPEREALFDYSEKAIGSSSSIMTVRADNAEIIAGDVSSYQGARVGLVTGSSHNEKFAEYAAKKGFSYLPVYYEDISQLLADLRAGQNIDIAVTSNMRLVHDEVILDEFNATEYYAIVRKGDEALLQGLDNGINQLSVYSPDWRTKLFEKYYSDINSRVISFSADERAYLAELAASGTVIKAAMNPELRPYSYFENGQAKGIAPAIFAEIAARLGLQYEILPSATRWEYKEQLNSGEADIDLTAYLDYSLAQRYHLKETDAYMTSTLALLSRKDSNTDPAAMTVAYVRDPTEYVGYNTELIDGYAHKEYESIAECIQAVKDKQVDATFRYVYIAEQAAASDYTNRLQYTVLPEYTFSLCLGVNSDKDHRLLAILNKGVNSLPDSFTQGVLLQESTNFAQSTSLLAVVYDHPAAAMGLAVLIVALAALAALAAVRAHAQKARYQVLRRMDRFIGYVCESYELVSEVDLAAGRRTTYTMKNGVLSEEKSDYRQLDSAYFEKLVPPEEVPRMTEAFSGEALNRLIEQGGEKYLECQVKNADGEYRWQSYILRAVARDALHPCNYVVFKKDVQDAKISEEQQKQLLRDALNAAESASAAKGQFLSRVSHEIRTPLNAVIGYMEIAKASPDDPDKINHCIENSGAAAKHLLSIINDVLDMSSIESGRLKIAHEEFNLKTQLTGLSTMFFHQAKAKGVRFEVALSGVTQEWMIGDSLRLSQILMNLLSNAVKFTPEGGSITLTVEQSAISDKRLFLKFSVTDTGIGMSKEYQQRLFKPFEQESALTAQKYGGTGLGLSITSNLVHLMGGSIEAVSEQGKGSTFTVALHFDRSFAAHDESPLPEDYSHVRVLIVDDDEAACEYMQALFTRCKVKCDVASDGETALKQIKRRMGGDYAYDMCLLDWNMPGMNGIETARRIREQCDPNLPIIIATAYDASEFSDQAKELGVTKIIAKPLFQSTMFDLLVSTFGKYRPVKPKSQNLDSIRGLKVLLAEDNPMNLEIAVEILKKAGLTVEPVTDGKQALDTFTAAPAGSYDAILMDVQMPVMDGYAATEAIRRSAHPQAKTIPIIAMTANAFAEDVNAAMAAGMNSHIAKPVDYDKLYSVLNEFCCKGANHHE